MLQKAHLPIKILSLLSLVFVAVAFWYPSQIGFYLLLIPYLLLLAIARPFNYRSTKLAAIRTIGATITLLMVPALLFGIESDPQAGIAVMFLLIIQMVSLSCAELLLFFRNSTDDTES